MSVGLGDERTAEHTAQAPLVPLNVHCWFTKSLHSQICCQRLLMFIEGIRKGERS